MNVPEILKTIGEQISGFASGKLAFAKPISVAGRTIIPVSWVRYDFGAGGSTPATYRSMAEEAGGGGGGQVSVIPAGIIEITPTRTRFIPIPDAKKIFALIASSVAGSGMNNGGAAQGTNKSLNTGKAPSKKEIAAYAAGNKKAVGKRSLPAAKKSAAKKVAVKKAAPVKTSRSSSKKTASKKASTKQR
jgi:uncharacterized spore protein YtfJ